MSIKELKEREKEQRREYIVDAAEKLFFSQGYDGVSMNDIAEAVEMNKATLYLYFENKETLYFAVVLRGARMMSETMCQAAASKQAGIDRLEAVGRAFFEYYRKHGDYHRLIRYALSGRFDLGQNEESRELHRLVHEMLDGMCEAVRAGMNDGSVRKDIAPMELAVFLITTSENVASLEHGMTEGLTSHGIAKEQYVRDVMSLLGHAIANPEWVATAWQAGKRN